MKINRTSSLKINIAKALLAIFIVFGFVLPAMAADEPEWIWTKNNPKPSWWKWGKDYYPEKPVRGGVMHYATTRGAGLMNPNHWPVNNFPLLSGIYDRLIYPEGQHLPKVPWLAKRWEYEDPTTIVMYLRKGVTFHDGSKFDAHSLKLQVDWINDKKNAAWSRNWIKPLKSIEVIDDYTVRWRTKKVWAGFYDIFANVPGWLLSPKALLGGDAKKDAGRLKNKIKLAERKVGKAQKKVDKASGAKAKKANKKLKSEKKKLAKLKKDLAKAMSLAEGARDLDEWAVGSGPWMMDDRRPDNYIKLKRNPNWWFGKSVGHPDMPYMDGAVYTVIPELSVKLANLKAGKIDTLTIDYSQYPQVKNDPKLDVWITPANSTLWLAFNEQGVFKDIRLRKAVSHAVDRKAVVAAAAGGFGRIASAAFPPEHFAHNPNLKPVKYDPELSRKLLKQAGYPNGLTIRGALHADSQSRRYGEVIKVMLKMVGITWDLKYVEPVAAFDIYRNLEYDLGTLVEGWVKDPDSFLTGRYHPDDDPANMRNNIKPVQKLIEEARLELDFEKRSKKYWEVERLLYEGYHEAWLWHYTTIAATRKQVRGYNREMQIAAGEAYWPTHPHWFRNGKRN
jgi:ABC-type transport system substrate-binding protein